MPVATSRLAPPTTLDPQLCTSASTAPAGAEWLHEVKYDGWRLLARKHGRDVRLYTRGGVEWSERLPNLAAAVRSLNVYDVWMDGEIVYLDDQGFPDFVALQHAMRARAERRLVYQVFDMPWLNGESLARATVLERKARLRELVTDATPCIRFVEHIVGNGPAVFEQASALDLEGIVSKRIASRYHAGERTRDWLKVKSWRTRSVVIGGVQFDVDGRLEAVLIGTPDNGGLKYEGRVELGMLGKLRDRMASLGSQDCPFLGEWNASERRIWLRPEIRVEVRALPQRAGAVLRHATIVRSE
jgi:bifunctional non-homologous end joining protein LigD